VRKDTHDGDAARPVHDPPGIVFLDLEQIYQFRSFPARRVRIASPAGKPYVIRLRTGELLAAYTFRYIADLERMARKGYWSEVRWSSDDGETWSEPVCPFPGVPRTKEATLVELADGRVLCLVHSGDRAVHTPTATISQDRGRTWEEPWEFDVSRMFPSNSALSNRSHIPLGDGSVILFFSDFHTHPLQTWACHSHDGGRTARECWHVGDYIGDQSFVRLPSGKFLAAVRVFGELVPDKRALPYGHHPTWAEGLGGGEAHDYIAITGSLDQGRTWSPFRPLTRYGEVPSQLLGLADGRILLTYGVRHYPMGAQAVLSPDQGETWDLDHRLMLAWHGAPYGGSLPDWGHPYPNGHPYSVQRSDGKVLTLYYRTADPARADSTVVEGVIWEVPA
jgi:hypothetical protein